MPRKSATVVDSRPPAYRYSPGDGHTYTWDGGPTATVWRHQARVTGPHEGWEARLQLTRTRDTVPMDGCARTATAFAARVAAWKVTRP